MGRSRPYNDETDHAEWLVHCTGCGFRRRNPMPDYCQLCGSPLEVEFDYGEDLHPERLFDGCITDLWKYGSLYPVSLSHSVDLSLGEGGTPLVRIWCPVSRRCLLGTAAPKGGLGEVLGHTGGDR